MRLKLPQPRPFETLELALPLGPVAGAGEHASPHLCVRTLSLDQARALRRLELGLDALGATCAMPSGAQRRVICRQDAVRWLLDRIVEAGA